MKVFNNFTGTDKKILGISFLILFVLSYLLYDDSILYPRLSHGDQTPVGTLSSLENDVRKKSIADFIWLPGSKKDEIYNQDSIFTGDQSRASIQLADGSIIQIQENSLVNINVKNGQMQLDLRFGQLTGTGKSTIRVKTATDDYTIDGKDGRFEVNRSAGGALDVKVLSGKAEVNGPKGHQNLKPNESLQITDHGVAKNEGNAEIKLTTKDDIILYRKIDKDPLRFDWTGKGPLAQFQLEISADGSFKKLLALQMGVQQNMSVTDPLKEGTYYWRVKGLDSIRKNLATSSTQKFYLSYLIPPQIISPQNEATLKPVALETDKGLKAPFVMSWDGNPRMVKYHLQLSNNDDFSEILAEKTLVQKTLRTPDLSTGKYFVRVRGFDSADHPSEWSSIHTVNLAIESEERPPAPKLINLLTKFKMPTLNGRAPAAEESPQLEWTVVDVARNYHWELAANDKFVGAKTMDTELTKVAWTSYKPGRYYYRVFTRSELGQLSEPSETGTIEVLGSQPVIQPIPKLFAKETNPSAKAPAKILSVNWSDVPGAARYSLEMDTKPEFTSPIQKDVVALGDRIPVTEPGKYFFRVKAQNALGQDISEYSAVEEAVYEFQITLRTVALIEPANKTTVFLQKDTEPYVWFSWSRVPNAASYVIEFSMAPDFSKVFFSHRLGETRYLVKNKIPYGTIFWRVRAISSAEGYSSDWATWQFTILQQRNQGF